MLDSVARLRSPALARALFATLPLVLFACGAPPGSLPDAAAGPIDVGPTPSDAASSDAGARPSDTGAPLDAPGAADAARADDAGSGLAPDAPGADADPGASDVGAGDADVDLAPTVEILFPPPRSVSAASAIAVLGRAADDRAIARVEVNGVLAESSDGYLTWEARVPLDPGETTLTVEVEDSSGTTATDRAIVSRATFFDVPMDTAYDPGSRRLFVVDSGLRAVLEVDLVTREPRVLSGPGVPDDTVPFADPVALAVDAARSRLLVVDRGIAALVAVDLTTGVRTVVSDATRPSATLPFSRPRHLVIDAAADQAYVVDSGLLAMLRVDLATGARAMVSSSTIPDGAEPFVAPVSVALDRARNRAYVLNFRVGTAGVDAEQGSIVSVDLTTGARTVLSSRTVPDSTNVLGKPTHVVYEGARDRLLVLSQTARSVFAVSPTTGARTLLSGDLTQPTVLLGDARGIAMDLVGDQFFSADLSFDHALSVDLATGTRTSVASNRVPRDAPHIGNPIGLARSATGRLFTNDSLRSAIVGYDPVTDTDAIVADLTASLGALAHDADRARLVGLAGSVVRTVALADGATTDLATLSVSGQGLAIDPAGARALITVGGAEVGVVSVALDTGAVATLSSPTIPDATSPFVSPGAIVWDPVGGRALVFDAVSSELRAVDGVTGARSVLTTLDAGVIVPAMILDAEGTRLLVSVHDTTTGSARVVGVELATGAQSVVYEAPAGLPLVWGDGLAHGALPRLLWVSDSSSQSLHVIDLASGSHVLVRRGAPVDWLIAA